MASNEGTSAPPKLMIELPTRNFPLSPPKEKSILSQPRAVVSPPIENPLFAKQGVNVGGPKKRLTSFPSPGLVSNFEDLLQDKSSSTLQKGSPSESKHDPVRQYWMPDKVCKVCSDCGETFNMFRRRHHCRSCGNIFCNACSPQHTMDSITYGQKTPKRLCKHCRSLLESNDENSATDVGSEYSTGLSSPQVSQTVFDYGNIGILDKEYEPDNVSTSSLDGEGTKPSGSLYEHLFRRPSLELTDALKAIQEAEEAQEKPLSPLAAIEEESQVRYSIDMGTPRQSLDIEIPIRPSDPAPSSLLEAHQLNARKHLRQIIATELEKISCLSPADRDVLENEIERVIEESTSLLLETSYNRSSDGYFNHQDLIHVKTIAQVEYDGPCAYSGEVIYGIVCQKNVSHKKAPKEIDNPRVFLLGGSIMYGRTADKLSVLEELLAEEQTYVKLQVDKILAVKPDVVFVEQSVSRLAQELFQNQNIALVLKVKESTMQRLERHTGAQIVESIDTMPLLDGSMIGTRCGSFHVTPMLVYDSTKPGGKRESFMTLTDCDRSAGCTILMKGPKKEILKELKLILKKISRMAYDIILKAQALSDFSYPIMDYFDRWNIQFVKYILKHCDEENKPKFIQCSRPQPFKLEFYSKDDKALGSYLQKDSIDSSTRCQVQNCKVPLIEHLEAYTFHQGTILISTEHVPESARSEIERTVEHVSYEEDDTIEPVIFFWRYCRECSKMVTPPRVLPSMTLKYSFARFLETIFFQKGKKSNEILNDEGNQILQDEYRKRIDYTCIHDGQRKHLMYFKYGKHAIRVEYIEEIPWYIKHDHCHHFDTNWYIKYQNNELNELKFIIEQYIEILLLKLISCIYSHDVLYLELLLRTGLKKYLNEINLLIKNNGEILNNNNIVFNSNTIKRNFYYSCKEWIILFKKIIKLNVTELNNISTELKSLNIENPINIIAPLEVELSNDGLPPPLPIKTDSLNDTIISSTPSSPVSWTTALGQSLGFLGDKKLEFDLNGTFDIPECISCGNPFLSTGYQERIVFLFENLRFSYATYTLNSIEYYNERQLIQTQYKLIHIEIEKLLLTSIDTTIKLKFNEIEFTCHVHYAIQFEALRNLFYGQEIDFIKSLASSLHWSAKGGKSGATFFRTQDDRFVIKYINQIELQSFLASAVSYFNYIGQVHCEGMNSVLSKVVGIFTVTSKKWTEHIVVMENAFSKVQVNNVFDLKGSTRNRYVISTEDVLLDGNFLEKHLGIPCPLHCISYLKLVDAVRNDVKFLSENNIMDYSLIVGYAPEISMDDIHDDNTNRVLMVGIIDYLRHFDFLKRMESVGKSVTMIAGQAAPTIIQPKQYGKRFLDAIEQQYFMPVPSFHDEY